MEPKQTLEEYIRQNYANVALEPYLCTVPHEFHHFLLSTKVAKCRDPAITTIPTLHELHYREYIDSLLNFLVQAKLSNVIANGYVNPAVNDSWSTTTVSPYCNFQVHHIKGENWNRLHNLMGRVHFTELLLTTKGFVALDLGNYLQLFGIPTYFTNQSNSLQYHFTNFTLLNKTRKNQGLLTVFNDTARQKFGQIANSTEYEKLLSILQRNDRRCRYSHIFQNVVGRNVGTGQPILGLATPLKQVIKFVLVIIGKLMPLSIFGCSSNKTLFVQSIVHVLKSPPHSRFNLADLFANLDQKEVKWSKQDLTAFYRFLEVSFIHIVFKIIQSFWYVTSASDNSSLIFFPHKVWNKVTRSWMRKYCKQYLYKSCEGIVSSDPLEKFNYGYLRLIPKGNDFRLILVPGKAPYLTRTEPVLKFEFEFSKYTKEYIDVARLILTLRSSQTKVTHPRCHSSRDIAKCINHYKLRLIEKFGSNQFKVYMLKFDMKQCYDRLNQKKVLQCVEALFGDLPQDYSFSVRSYMECPIDDLKARKSRTLVKDQTNILDFYSFNMDLNRNEAIALVDKVKTYKMTKKQLLEISKLQIFETGMLINPTTGTMYKRKTGVFQGCPLLSTFCNITYDHMVEQEFGFVVNLDSLLLRVVDDFLILSTDANVCESAKNLIYTTQLHKYGAFVNKSKTYLSDGESDGILKFLGLDINMKTLELYRDYSDVYNIPLAVQESPTKVLQHLIQLYRSRLEDFLINRTLCNYPCVAQNILNNLKSVLDILILNYKVPQERQIALFDELKLCLLNLVRVTRDKYIYVNGTESEFGNIKHEMVTTILMKFKKRQQFKQIVDWIQLDKLNK
jgi:telomerase reverse transcriptase